MFRIKSNNSTIVVTYGTFDLFHVGHLRLLKRLRALGDKLIVGISSDEFNQEKGKVCLMPYEQRAEIVESLACVDGVFKEENWGQKKSDLQKYNADIFAMGSDWTGKFDELKQFCDVVYLERTSNISTTDIKKSLKDIYGL